MEIRGIVGVLAPNEIKPGTFFVQSDRDTGAWTCLRVTQPDAGSKPRTWDVVFDRPDRHGISFWEPEDVEPIAVLPTIAIRIDPTSLLGTQYSTNFRPQTLVVAGADVFLKAKSGRIGNLTINLRTGEVASPPADWVAFSRWSLVVDGDDGEVVLFSWNGEGA